MRLGMGVFCVMVCSCSPPPVKVAFPVTASVSQANQDASIKSQDSDASTTNTVASSANDTTGTAQASNDKTNASVSTGANQGSSSQTTTAQTDSSSMIKTNSDSAMTQVTQGSNASLLDCGGDGTVGANDLMIFDGETHEVKNGTVPLNSDWTLDETWDNGKLGVEKSGNRFVLTFGGDKIYHGFKITPSSKNGSRRTFVAKGVDIYVNSNKADDAGFGLRLIKPNEDEGNGGAPTTSWYKQKPNSDDGDNVMVPSNINSTCKIISLYAGNAFLNQNKVANRLIWEMQTNWAPADKLQIHRIVLKDFSWK